MASATAGNIRLAEARAVLEADLRDIEGGQPGHAGQGEGDAVLDERITGEATIGIEPGGAGIIC
jgi:hypothetical protein